MQQLIQGGYGFDELSKAMMIGVCKNRKTILRVPKDNAVLPSPPKSPPKKNTAVRQRIRFSAAVFLLVFLCCY